MGCSMSKALQTRKSARGTLLALPSDLLITKRDFEETQRGTPEMLAAHSKLDQASSDTMSERDTATAEVDGVTEDETEVDGITEDEEEAQPAVVPRICNMENVSGDARKLAEMQHASIIKIQALQRGIAARDEVKELERERRHEVHTTSAFACRGTHDPKFAIDADTESVRRELTACLDGEEATVELEHQCATYPGSEAAVDNNYSELRKCKDELSRIGHMMKLAIDSCDSGESCTSLLKDCRDLSDRLCDLAGDALEQACHRNMPGSMDLFADVQNLVDQVADITSLVSSNTRLGK